MATSNKKRVHKSKVDTSAPRLAGGAGNYPAAQNNEKLLRRGVMACLLWEDVAYQDGVSVAENIKRLIPLVSPEIVAAIAIEARQVQKLRHVPLFIAREMARLDTHKGYVGGLLPRIIQRADEIGEFLSMYFLNGDRRQDGQKISKQVRIGLARAFENFTAYHFAKYKGKGKAVTLQDALRIVRPKPAQGRDELYKQIRNDNLPSPRTWENRLSSGEDANTVWTEMIMAGELGALAFLRNLRNMEAAKVSRATILHGFETINPKWLLPMNYLASAKVNPQWEREIEALMFRGLGQVPKLPGHTIFIVDVSGSMKQKISTESEYSRLDVACSMAMLAAEMCEGITIYATAGNDGTKVHKTVKIAPRRGFGLPEVIVKARETVGTGGIFTRQALEWISEQEHGEKPARIIIFSDSQDCDLPTKKTPAPFGVYNYIVDVSSNDRGVGYEGIWTAEISGWSEHFIPFIAAMEGLTVQEGETENQ